MAQYEITRTCGHVETVNILGTNVRGERERQAAREAEKLCWDCYTTRRDTARRETSARAAEVAEAAGLPALTGTDKQIAWAQSIRIDGLAEIADRAARLFARWPAAADRLAAICTRIALAHTDARWWINNRTRIFIATREELTDADRTELQEATK